MRRWTYWFRVALIGFGLSTLCSFPVFAENRSALSVNERQYMMHEGIERSYEIRVPAGLIKGVRVPLVLVLHGGGGNGPNAEKMTGFTQKAIKENFIVVYPEGVSRSRLSRLYTWNAVHCCGYAMEKKTDDIGFIHALLNKLIANYPVDEKRVYVTGLSNGGMMAHRLGIELSFRIAAIAPVIAALFGDETRPTHPVSAMIINGMLDRSVPYQGGAPGGRFPDALDGTPIKPAENQADFWAAANGCEPGPDIRDSEMLAVTRYRCPQGKDVIFYLVKDSGHAWPGGKAGTRRGDKPGSSINATDIIWDFFKAQAK